MPATAEEAEENFEQAIEDLDGIEDFAAEAGLTIVPVAEVENTFNITGVGSGTEAPEGTGFFTTLADLGIGTMTLDGTTLTVSDGEGNVTVDRAAVEQAVAAGLLDGTLTVTVNVPYGDGSQTTPVTYTFNFLG